MLSIKVPVILRRDFSSCWTSCKMSCYNSLFSVLYFNVYVTLELIHLYTRILIFFYVYLNCHEWGPNAVISRNFLQRRSMKVYSYIVKGFYSHYCFFGYSQEILFLHFTPRRSILKFWGRGTAFSTGGLGVGNRRRRF